MGLEVISYFPLLSTLAQGESHADEQDRQSDCCCHGHRLNSRADIALRYLSRVDVVQQGRDHLQQLDGMFHSVIDLMLGS